MRRTLAIALAAPIGVTATLVGSSPANAANVRYRAASSCVVDGVRFHADIQTWGKPTPQTPGVYTEVQLWGYRFERSVNASWINARKVIWRDGSWQDAGSGIGYENDPVANGRWHNAPRVGGNYGIGYILPDRPMGVMITAYLGGYNFCRFVLRPYDLYYTG